MRKQEILDLAECTEFRLLVEARPPRVVHATVYLLLSLTIAGLGWSHFTSAELIVRAPGRIRPIETPVKILSAARAESLSAGHANRISEVHVREGDRVQAGQVLLRLDAARLDNEIDACRARLSANQEELGRIDELEQLVVVEFSTARAKADAELREAVEDIRAAEERRHAELQIAETELASAHRDVEIQEPLAERRVVTKSELDESKDKLKRAMANLEKAKLVVNAGPQLVLEQALELAERQHQVKRKELAMKRAEAVSRATTLQAELKNLELEHAQSVIRSPIDGVVIVGDLKLGDSVEPNKVLFEIATTKGFRFEAQLSSEDVAHVVGAMPARIKLHAYDYQRYGVLPGVVEFVSPDSTVAAESKVPSYAVRIDVPGEIHGRQLVAPVKLGMTGEVEIVTERRSLLSLLIGRVRQTIRLG
jgi:adhesin transport system membrane fusion protein